MNSGQGGKNLSAREMTESINQETDRLVDEAVLAGAENVAEGVTLASEAVRDVATENGMSAAQAQNLGQRVMSGSVEAGVLDGRNTEVVRAALEVSEDLNRAVNSEEFVGEETPVLADEYAQQDEQAAKIETEIKAGGVDSLEAKITKKSLEGVAEAVAPEVDKMLRQSVIDLNGFVDDFRDWNRLTLETVGRKIGDRN